MKKIVHYAFLLVSILLLASCRDELPLDTFEYENYLVVEAMLTNVQKRQEIRLSRTTQLDTSFANVENNAEVYVVVNETTRYDFEQNEDDGTYVSTEVFDAQTGNDYQLFINTSNGKSYSSAVVRPETVVTISDLYAERAINKDSIEGIQVLMDVKSDDSRFFRFQYEETYKIVSPFPSPVDFTIINYEIDERNSISFDVDTMANPRLEEESVCYTTKMSTGFNLGSSGALERDVLLRQPIVFIPADDPKLQQRYSILGKVLSQNASSYTFYKNLEELSTNDDLLSQKQPGFIAGNIIAMDENGENVLGFFDVAMEAEQRIYFNHSDFNFKQPPYFYDCDTIKLNYNDNTVLDRTPNQREEIYSSLISGKYNIYQRFNYGDIENTYILISDLCSDCTEFSSHVKPLFWED
ncbi:DUF4249 domain-containing protein [Flavimarina sp. Hel_I_48]|uniref:DUF4249 domain-containing protein n=1 Tax=Flavimarina sp. Hel_I_48 TaxID=1392488 RepID=UPI0004DF23AB|nr:DUF4249 domain-containing protein [Flavimarina sp. Hel_I_48]